MNELVHPRALTRSSDYDVDLHAWTRAQVDLLRARRFDLIDVDNIAEEIESLGKEQPNAIESQLARLGEHLIKLLISQDEYPRRVWRVSVISARDEIARRLEFNPSLRRRMPDYFTRNWPQMRKRARAGLGEPEAGSVPDDPPFTLEQALDEDWLP